MIGFYASPDRFVRRPNDLAFSRTGLAQDITERGAGCNTW